MNLTDSFSEFSEWRDSVGQSITQLKSWLIRNEVGDAQTDLRLNYLLERLREEKLTVAFVAEFSRGKSELINAVFFADYGDRILPSSAGRTTMCPTELHWEAGQEPSIRLLPIETRARGAGVQEFKRHPEEWITVPIDVSSTESMQRAMSRVGETKRVSPPDAVRLGFAVDPHGKKGARIEADGKVEIAAWRHAMIQFPHPLLKQGLVVVDTPGLNAIGSEPELTLSLLPNAHAVLFILAVDTGVTQSDLAVWQEYIVAGKEAQRGRVVVLNKIDSLWDGMRSEAQIAKEIRGQVSSVSRTLSVPENQIFPVSAQKALLAKVTRDPELLDRSQVEALESALTSELLPTRQEIVRDNARGETGEIIRRTRELLNARLRSVQEQVRELSDLRGKNRSVIEYMMRKVRAEKNEFEQGLQKYHATRSVFTSLSNNLYAHLGLDALRTETRRTREAMLEANFSRGLREAMERFFDQLRDNLRKSADEVGEIQRMLDTMYKKFAVEHGLKLASPTGFSTLRYEKEIERLRAAFNQQLNTVGAMVLHRKGTVTQRFFDTIALEARRTFEMANRDVDQWLRAVMSPLETQVREYQIQLKRRLESVKRIHEATGTLEERIAELDQSERAALQQLAELSRIERGIAGAIGIVGELAPAEAPARAA
ncbi:dynamin family protein [Niveibacterium sp. 24ML]|uniref:dynamin family protein n=1 Tax=Niveibacterium sp. 24ML TaxID=2985512 RepID=UPI002271F7CE|nr:dynamin family protein [Niveibacterium sp. 24ML]MCX9155563.1 dynamin family protein [Niveibacterium sp. 24ML]